MNQKQERAIDIYKNLGYEDRPYEEINQLGTGTKEEKKIAKEGLQRGEWWEFREIEKNTYGSVNIMGVDLSKLAVFAIKVGVDARRAVNVLDQNSRVALEAIMERGEEFAQQFISAECRADRRSFEHSSTRFGSMGVQLLHLLNLEIPDNVEYLKNWTHFAAVALGLIKITDYERSNELLPTLDMIRSRTREHLIKGIYQGCPSTGPFSLVFTEALKEGLISEAEAKDLIFLALDMASRPGDRKQWVKVLDDLGFEDEDISSRAESLIPLLAHGETLLTEKIAPMLISQAEEDKLAEILVSAYNVKSKKAKSAILKLVLERGIKHPSAELIDWLNFIQNTDDKTLLSQINKISSKWKVELQKEEAEGEVLDLWQACPELWELPRFEMGELSQDSLIKLAAEISERSDMIPDLKLELFLNMVNEMARKNPGEAKLCLGGMRNRGMDVTGPLLNWAKNKEHKSAVDRYYRNYSTGKEELNFTELIRARNQTLINHIDSLPCILSTPTFVDLSLDLKTLVSHLRRYQEADWTYVYEPDLHLALTRLDVASAGQEDLEALENINLNIKLPSEEVLKDSSSQALSVSEVVKNYLKDPHIEPELNLKEDDYFRRNFTIPRSLKDFPNRFYYSDHHHFSIFPLWGDYALSAVRRDKEVYHGQGLILRQVARRRRPLGGAGIINFLAAQSYVSDENAGDVILATKKAWERGLLPPADVDVKALDWRYSELSGLASLAAALDEIAKDGLLSLVWKILDDLIGEALKKNRIASGTAELAKVMKHHLTEVLHAVKHGLADEGAFELKGLRRLADKTGSSSAVTVAKEIIRKVEIFEAELDQKPADRREAAKEDKTVKKGKAARNKEARLMPDISFPELPFEDVWVELPKPKPYIQDHAEMSIELVDTKRSIKLLLFVLHLPHREEHKYIVLLDSWFYSLDSEGQVPAIEIGRDEAHTPELLPKKGRQVWLYWDEKEGGLTVSPHRNSKKGKDGPLGGERKPLSSTLLSIVLALQAQDGDAVYYIPRLAQNLIQMGELNEEAIRDILPKLFEQEVLSPAKLIRHLEKDATLLPVFWPILVQAIIKAEEKAGTEGKIPVWINRVLDVGIYYSKYLKEAVKRGLIGEEELPKDELGALTASKAKSSAKAKAGLLLELLEI